LLHSAIRAVKRAVAASHRQKFDSDCEEKFDCDEHARRFDLIRSSRPLLLLRASSHADESCSMIAINGSRMGNNDPRRRAQSMGKSGIERICVGCSGEASHANARVVVNGVNGARER
jgi:hypothetical protein